MFPKHGYKVAQDYARLNPGTEILLSIHRHWMSWICLNPHTNRVYNVDHVTEGTYKRVDGSLVIKWDNFGTEIFFLIQDFYVCENVLDEFTENDQILFDRECLEYEPWRERRLSDQARQQVLQSKLSNHLSTEFGREVFISKHAHIVAYHLRMGAFSWIAGQCLIRGNIEIGVGSGINFGVVLAGNVKIGKDTHIASGTAIYGFNHNYRRADLPMIRQGFTAKGIDIGDDVWIGTNVVILDGVKVGSHSVVAAGAVVTHDVEPYMLVGGVPARTIADKRLMETPASAETTLS